ncbi:uncharacterized protein LOC131627055 [Vicia villosa]|uniref:uncharacterized protein LOC131627055 n=1 Tax=Vicia villosa TaxID=3911 RepID=UPI00273C3ED6|nr:uncharacterized protein LOC131627055 [Vicia villosa]
MVHELVQNDFSPDYSKIQYVLDPDLEEVPEPTADDTDEIKKERKKRKEDELLCHGHILNTLSDCLYDLYTNTASAKEIWKALEFKFKAEEEGTKKFLISKYFDFKMLDSKPILAQVHELQVLVNKIKAVKIDVPEAFQVGAIIEKLPPSWKGYRKKLLHSSEDFSHSKPKTEVNVVHVNDDIITTVSEVMAIKGKVQGWWYDTCATVHVSYDKATFKTYTEVNGGHKVQMGNEVRSRVVGTGSVELNFTFGNKLALVNVLHVPDMK